MGPSDYGDFYMIDVDKSILAKWKMLMTPLKEIPEYHAHKTMREWWINRDSYPSLRFYDPKIFTGRIHGFIYRLKASLQING